MQYLLVYNSPFDQELYQIEEDNFFEGSTELVLYVDESHSACETSKKELISLEPWMKKPTPQRGLDSEIPVALLELF